jgi:hypothetical protein
MIKHSLIPSLFILLLYTLIVGLYLCQQKNDSYLYRIAPISILMVLKFQLENSITLSSYYT